MAKQILIRKQDSKKKDRYCLWCGTNISHRSKDVQFCCPNCKALYKDMQKMKDSEPPEKPKQKLTKDFFDNPYSAYQSNPIK